MNQAAPKTAHYCELPIERRCGSCGETKTREQMVVSYDRSARIYYFRPDCKKCYAAKARQNAQRRVRTAGYAVPLIRERFRKRGYQVSIAAAEELLSVYGRYYPMERGLTKRGRKEFERIRSRLRYRTEKKGRGRTSDFEIRMMVYEQGLEDPGLFVPPAEQIHPYQPRKIKRFAAHR